MPDIDFRITNKHKQDVLDDIFVEVARENGSDSHEVFSGKVHHKKGPKKGKKAGVDAGKTKLEVVFKESTGLMRKIAGDVDVGSDITKLRVHLSPLGIGHKLRLEIKAWGSDGWKGETTYSLLP